MPDLDLNDDQLKLVRYRILFVKRDYETAFPHADVLVHDNLNSGAFAAWKVAEFIEKLHDIPVPAKWGGSSNRGKRPNYPCNARWDDECGRWVVNRLDDDDYKYLRVSYEVEERYPRQNLEYEEDHLKVLRQIRDQLSGRPSGPGDGGHRRHDCDTPGNDCDNPNPHHGTCACDACRRGDYGSSMRVHG